MLLLRGGVGARSPYSEVFEGRKLGSAAASRSFVTVEAITSSLLLLLALGGPSPHPPDELDPGEGVGAVTFDASWLTAEPGGSTEPGASILVALRAEQSDEVVPISFARGFESAAEARHQPLEAYAIR